MNVNEDEIDKCVEILNRGGVLLLPTDTVYGLFCDSTNLDAIKRIYEIKNRNISKKLALFIGDIAQISDLCEVNDFQLQVVKKFITHQFTFILDAITTSDHPIVREFSYDKIGFRMTGDGFLKQLCVKFGKPLASTSANLSSYPDSSIFDNIDHELVKKCDFFINDDCCRERSASSIVDISKYINSRNASYVILRSGEKIDRFLKFVNN